MNEKSLFGTGLIFNFQDKSYNILPWTLEIQAAFEQYMISTAWENVMKQKSMVGEQEYDKLIHSLRQDIDTDFFAFGGEAFFKFTKKNVHYKHLMFLLLGYSNKGNKNVKITKAFIDAIFEDSERYEHLHNLISEVNRDPKEKKDLKEEEETPDPKV